MKTKHVYVGAAVLVVILASEHFSTVSSMKTKLVYVGAAVLVVILASASCAYATSYQSQCVNNSDVDVIIEIDLALSGAIHLLRHTVQSVLYTLTGLIAALLQLTWKLTFVIDGVVHELLLVIPCGADIEITADLEVLVGGVSKGFLYH